MVIRAIQTRLFRRGENLADFVVHSVPKEDVRERLVLAVTSKIVSLAENRFVPKDTIEKKDLVRREADIFLGEVAHGCLLTIKHGHLLVGAGIDESNSEVPGYILYPENPYQSARALWQRLREAWRVKELGIILTDSRTFPLRRGVTGVCLSHAGFQAVKNMVGTKDLFGRELRMTQINYADGLAAAAVLGMGEGAESRPLALLTDTGVEFAEDSGPSDVQMGYQEDLYLPLLEALRRNSEKTGPGTSK